MVISIRTNCDSQQDAQKEDGRWNARFEVFTAVTMEDVVFWDIKPQFIPHRRHISSLGLYKRPQSAGDLLAHMMSVPTCRFELSKLPYRPCIDA
jgi:hypothetical protein